MGLFSRGKGNPSRGVNPKQIWVEGPVSAETHPSIGVNRKQITN